MQNSNHRHDSHALHQQWADLAKGLGGYICIPNVLMRAVQNPEAFCLLTFLISFVLRRVAQPRFGKPYLANGGWFFCRAAEIEKWTGIKIGDKHRDNGQRLVFDHLEAAGYLQTRVGNSRWGRVKWIKINWQHIEKECARIRAGIKAEMDAVDIEFYGDPPPVVDTHRPSTSTIPTPSTNGAMHAPAEPKDYPSFFDDESNDLDI